MNSIVSIDIETTGLSEERDAIIEIGAVKFKGHRVEDEWTSVINPGKHIPEFITNLTGISDAEVRNAPKFRDIAQDLEAFVGNAPVIGHNVRFDLEFLQKGGILRYNEVIDTYELAAVLMPTASRYNLGALGKQLGILLPATHRALDDAKVTMAAFNKLFELARELPLASVVPPSGSVRCAASTPRTTNRWGHRVSRGPLGARPFPPRTAADPPALPRPPPRPAR